MSLKEFQQLVDQFVNQFEVGYWPPLAMLGALIEEIGETARIINAKEGHKPMKVENHNLDNLLSEEIGDILFSITCLANFYNIDLHDSFAKTLDKYNHRDKTRWVRKEEN